MDATKPCYRHSRATWMAACDDCTAWHLAAVRARRDAASAQGAARTTLRPVDRQPVALRLVA
jgi:hypothetical protein